MGILDVLSSASVSKYSDAALSLISNSYQDGSYVGSIAQTYDVSAYAIGSAIAREWDRQYKAGTPELVMNTVQDWAAREGVDLANDWINSFPNDLLGENLSQYVAIIKAVDFSLSHEQLLTQYLNEYREQGTNSNIAVMSDIGAGNVKVGTAIRLIRAYVDDPQSNGDPLGLLGSQRNYSANYRYIVEDLARDENSLTAKIYALMAKEAENFFIFNGAYGSDWANLPQEFKDALYLTYFTLGKTAVESRVTNSIVNGIYEPSPGPGITGGMGHLFNAKSVGDALGLSGYGGAVTIADNSQFLAQAESAGGIAHRYALYRLNAYVLPDLDYAARNIGGVLDLIDAEGNGSLSSEWIADRVAMLDLLTKRDVGADIGNVQVSYGDAITGKSIGAPSPDASFIRRIIFGSSVGNVASGARGEDHLYGGAGNDSLSGNDGNDYLEGGADSDVLNGGANDDSLIGGAGDDRYEFNTGDGYDTIIDSDGKGRIYIDGQLISYGYHRLGNDANVFHSVDGKFVLTLSGSDLVITQSDASVGDVITIKGYSSDAKSLGIDLDSEPVSGYNTEDLSAYFYDYLHSSAEGGVFSVPIPYTAANIVDDGPGSSPALITEGNDVIYGAGIVDIEAFANSDDGVSTSQTSLSEYHNGEGGNDVVIGGQHNDKLQGNAGNDILLGGDGNDGLWGDLPGQNYVTLINRRATSSNVMSVNTWGSRPGGGYALSDYGITDDGVSTYIIYDYDRAADGNDLISGGDGDDFVEGNGGDDALIGSYGNDTLQGDSGADHLSGGDGNDLLYGEYRPGSISIFAPDSERNYDDFLDGGAGNDTLRGGYGADQLYGGAGVDFLVGDSWYASVSPAQRMEGDDYLDGGADNDTLIGLGGRDTLIGGEGSDLLYGDDSDGVSQENAAEDYLSGGGGNDTLIGGAAADMLFGDDGDDELYGDNDSVSVDKQGNDTLDGGKGNDYLRGYGGNDILIGGEGNDSLYGEEGNDTLIGGADIDYLSGGIGDDRYILSVGDGESVSGLIDTISDSAGNNLLMFNGVDSSALRISTASNNRDITLHYSESDSVYIFNGLMGSVSNISVDGKIIAMQTLVGETLATAVSVKGGSGADVIYGGLANDYLDGREGNDSIWGGAGNDRLYARGGDDLLDGGAGDDHLSGADGNDRYKFGRGYGSDTLSERTADFVGVNMGELDVIELGSDVAPEDVTLIRGRTTSDLSSKDDLILFISGSSGTLTVGSYFFNSASDIDGDYRIEQIKFFDGTVWDVATVKAKVLIATAEDDVLRGYAGADVISGDGGDDWLDGYEGDDTLGGGLGNDTIEGGDGVDNLYGEEDADDLSGGADNDYLYGGSGNDVLKGGRGMMCWTEVLKTIY